MSYWKESFLSYTVCAACGVCFGIAAEKGQVHLPSVIRNQMTFSQFTMLKMFLPALASSCAVFSLLALVPAGRNIFETVRRNFASCLMSRSVGSVVMGGTILGIGMTLAGSCPGMIFIQLGTGVQHAVYTFAGCITGTILYGFLHSKLKSTENSSEKYLDKLLSVKYVTLGIPLIGLLMTVAFIVDNYFPEKTIVSANSSWMSMHAWNPIISGIIVGSLQLPLALAVHDSLGGSSSYCTLIANSMNNALPSIACNYFKSFLNNWWQVIFVGGAVLGGAISSLSSGTWGAAEGVSPYTAFLGGICLLFGARLASGCTSGHGISGAGLLNSFSFLTVMSMFGGAMGMAALMKALL